MHKHQLAHIQTLHPYFIKHIQQHHRKSESTPFSLVASDLHIAQSSNQNPKPYPVGSYHKFNHKLTNHTLEQNVYGLSNIFIDHSTTVK